MTNPPSNDNAEQIKAFLQNHAPDFVQEEDIRELLQTLPREALEEGMALIEPAPAQPGSEEAVPQVGNELWAALDPAEKQLQEQRKTIQRRWKQLATMAGLLVLAALVFVIGKKQFLPAAPDSSRPDVAPGGNRAVLLLANGSRLALDSVRSDTVFHLGNVQVIKQNGQLQYRTAGQPAGAVYHTLLIPRGGQYRLTLPDGTRVWLNAASSLHYPTQFFGGVNAGFG